MPGSCDPTKCRSNELKMLPRNGTGFSASITPQQHDNHSAHLLINCIAMILSELSTQSYQTASLVNEKFFSLMQCHAAVVCGGK